MKRNSWVQVDLDGLREKLKRRGMRFAVYEPIQNALDEDVTRVDVTLPRPGRGHTMLTVGDDSLSGFRDLADAYTMFKRSYKQADAAKRGLFNIGEKLVLALCEEATIATTSGTVRFDSTGRHVGRKRTGRGSVFTGRMRLTNSEWEELCGAVRLLIPTVPLFFNGELVSARQPVQEFDTVLDTVVANEDGELRRTQRKTKVRLYEPLAGEAAMLYEMGIPVVAIDSKYHVSVAQRVPLNMERDNVTPAYLKTIQVELLNHTHDVLEAGDSNAVWVRSAAGDPRCADEAVKAVLDLRFGERRVAYDPSDIGSNREAASRDYTVVTGGSMSAGEWANAKRAEAIAPASRLFPTDFGSKVPDKVYARSEWTPQMLAYATLVESVSPHLVGYRVTVRFIRDREMICGQFHGTSFTVNLARLSLNDRQGGIELMLHELAHTVVKSNDHLCHRFYETVTRLGAKLALLALEEPELFSESALKLSGSAV
jgi:hypothetical protein